jgi:hypothetical protein
MTIGVWALKIISLLISKDFKKGNHLTSIEQVAMPKSHGTLILEDYCRIKDLQYGLWETFEYDNYEAKMKRLREWAKGAQRSIDAWERMGATILSVDERSMDIEIHGGRRTVSLRETQTRLGDFGFRPE